MATGYYTRSRARAEHKAAGVLPFSLHEGAVLVLLGGEPCKTGPGGKVWRTLWRDFGGGREAVDADGEATAAREFAEETLGLFGACGVNAASVALAAAAMEARLHVPGQAVKVVHALKRGSYHFFITQQAFVSPLMFRLASQQNVATKGVAGAEKTAFAWVPLRSLLECVAEAKPRYFFEARAHVCGSAATPPLLACGRRRFQLHPCFANSLRMAQRQGLEELITQAEELPLPPPPLLPRPAAIATTAVIATPAASVQGCAPGSANALAISSPGPLGAAGAAAAAAAAAAAGAAGGKEEEGSDSEDVSSGVQDSMSYWLAQADVAAALRAGNPTVEPPGSIQQQEQLAGRSASLAPASSIDTASSLRASRQAVAAAAVDEVVQQIEANSHLSSAAKHRRSRKQRQKLRRQRKAAQQRAAAVAAAGISSSSPATGKRRLPAQADGEEGPASSAQAPLSPQASPLGQQQQQPPPPHWQHAMLELQAAFQPRLRLHKRMRLVMAQV